MRTVRVGLAGCGAIGRVVALELARRRSPYRVAALFDPRPESAAGLASRLKPRPRICRDLPELVTRCDFVMEAASRKAATEVARAALKARKPVLLMSTGGYLAAKTELDLLARQAAPAAKLYLPSGALAGLDGIRAARQIDPLSEVTLTTTKNPKGLLGAPGLTPAQTRRLKSCKAPFTVYHGDVAGAIDRFPANINVAVTLALAADALKGVRVRIVADPDIRVNQHEIRAKGSFGELACVTRNLPSVLNPKTSALAVQSALAFFERRIVPVEVGN